jgi:hypothetical protein
VIGTDFIGSCKFDEKILICHDFVSNENNFLTSGEEITSPKS